MKLKTIFLDALIAFFITVCPFTFTNPFASSFKDPTHEECRQWARDKLYACSVLAGISLISYFVAFNSDSIPALVGIAIPAMFVSLSSAIYLEEFYDEYSQHKNPQKTSEWLQYQKQFSSYKKNIELLHQKNESLRSLFYNKHLQIGAGAIGLGLLTNITQSDKSNPAYILTFAGTLIVAETVIVAEKIYSELKKAGL